MGIEGVDSFRGLFIGRVVLRLLDASVGTGGRGWFLATIGTLLTMGAGRAPGRSSCVRGFEAIGL